MWLPIGLLVGAALIGGLALKGNLYGAGKAFFWLTPFIVFLLLKPLAEPPAAWWAKLPALVYVALQALALILRLESVAADDGIPAAPPYPADQLPILKHTVDFDLARFFERAERCRLIRVDIPDPLLRHYVMVNLFARDLPYISAQEIKPFYDTSPSLGLQHPTEPPDCVVRVSEPAAPGPGGRRAFAVESLRH